MKKVYYILVAAVLLAFTSCKKYDDDIKRINDRLNRIEGTYISNIDKQIVGINSSLTDLSAVDVAMQKSIDALTAKSNELSDELKNNAAADAATKSALEKEIADLNALIATLQASNASLDGKITALQTYVGSELSATEDWATATFATLEQYSSLQTELAAIKALVDNGNTTIDELTQSINDAVAASEQSMKVWVNEQLAAGYYDIATIDAKLSALKGELADADSELAKNIDAQRAALEQAKSYLTAAYKEAIADAIETNNGLFNSTIAESVQAVKDKVDVRLALIDNTIASIQNEINTINSRIATIEQQIVGIVSSLYDLSAVDSALQKTVDALTVKGNELSEELKNNATADAATKTALEKEISDLNALIVTLQASNASLDGKITTLQTYVGSGLSATEDWATATFATLEQYASLQTELAAIKLLVGNGSGNTNIEELTQAINGAIAASEQSMKAWVNEQLAVGYYDIATIDAKLSALKGELTSSDSELAKDIEAQRAALEQAKSELTAAYKSAIADAIETNNGLLNSTIATAVQTAIDKVETKLAVIDNALAAIQQEIENIKNSIAGIQDQITAINGSLANLESVDAALQKTVVDLTAKSNELSEELKNNAAADAATKTALEKEISDLNAFIDALQAGNALLDGKITALQTYVGSELSATEDWATATFATLEQYASLQTELAAIKVLVGNGSGNTNIEELTQAINGAIAASEQSMKAWVNEQLATGYYDIATIDAKLSALAGELTSSDSELSKDIEAQRAALEQAKSELTAAYKSAIADAIETNNGLLNSTIATAVQTAIDKVETKLAVIDNALAAIQKEIENIKSSIAGIQQQINNINNSIEALKNTDKELKGYIEGLQTTANNLQEQINSTNTKIDNLKTELKGDISTAKAEVLAQLDALRTELEGELAQITAAITVLQAKDAELEKKITDLQNYVDTELRKTEDWGKATFATLEQYKSLANEVASIKVQITAINTSIADLETRLNEKIATDIAAAIAILNADIKQKVKEIIDAYTSAINTAKNEITAAYTAAINSAISALETSMQSWVNEQLKGYYTISEVDALLVVLEQEFNTKLEAQKTYLEGLINALSEELKGVIANNTTLITALRSDVSTLQNSTSIENVNKIAENATAIATNAQNIIANAEAISANSGNINANTSKIAENKSAIEANAALIAENKSAIAALKSSTDSAIAKNAADIATNAENIAKNAELIAKNATAINNNAEAIAQNTADIAQLQQDLATVKTEITEAYISAISTSITTLDGELRGEIATQVSALNTRIDNEVATINAAAIDALTARVTTLEGEVDAIQQQIADMQQNISDLMKRIRSVTYIPKYSDGKACVKDEVVELDFQVSPKSAVTNIAANWQSVLSIKAVYTITRAVSFVNMPILTCEADESNGVISITASTNGLSEDFYIGSQSASTALYISDGNSYLTSDFISLTPYHPYNEIWYTTTDANVVTPNATNVFGANIVSNTNENGKCIIRFDGAVSSIGEKAFYNCFTLTSVTIPNSVTKIGKNAFNYCTKLTSITIPNRVTSIGEGALQNCSSLTSVTIPNSVTSIGNSTFAFCGSLTSVNIPDGVTSIGNTTFTCCRKLTSITIPNRVTSIGEFAFNECSSLKSITIPNCVTSIGREAFYNCKGELIIDSQTLVEKDYTSSNYPTKDDGWLYGNKFTKLIIGNSVTSIGEFAFQGCSSLTSITIPNSVTSIGNYAFRSCSGLTNVTIPNSVTSIGERVFEDCSKLNSVTIGNSVTSIGSRAFYNCSKLTSVYCKPTTPPTAGGSMFWGYDTGAYLIHCKIYVPRNSVNAYKSASEWSSYVSDIVGYNF